MNYLKYIVKIITIKYNNLNIFLTLCFNNKLLRRASPAAATPEFGRRMFEVTVQRFVELVQEFQTIAVKPRVDHH